MEQHMTTICILFTVSLLLAVSALRPSDEVNILQLHNRLRKEYSTGRHGVLVSNMKKLKWSSTLSSRAQRITQCRNTNRLRRLDRANVNVDISPSSNVSDSIERWFSGINDFSEEFTACVHKGSCRYFMTMMRATNYRVGCARSPPCWQPDQQHIFVCLYSGSESLEYPIFKVGPPCSKCSGEMSFCEEGLCVSCPARGQLCDCRKTCGLLGVGSGYLDERSCTCSCAYGMGPNCDEACENPEQYEDWDVCADVTPSDCNDPDDDVRKLYSEFCPATCTCRKHPGLLLVGPRELRLP